MPTSPARKPTGILRVRRHGEEQLLQRRRTLNPRADVPIVPQEDDDGRDRSPVTRTMRRCDRCAGCAIDDAHIHTRRGCEIPDVWHRVDRIDAPILRHDEHAESLARASGDSRRRWHVVLEAFLSQISRCACARSTNWAKVTPLSTTCAG
jgi:hypothetical protein